MAYKDPPQLERLVKRLSHPGFDYYIHVDTKFDLQPFRYLENIDRVYLVKNRIKIRWVRSKNNLGCRLQLRTRFFLGDDIFIRSNISRLWDDPMMEKKYH